VPPPVCRARHSRPHGRRTTRMRIITDPRRWM
jgi:hypothetical protein